MVSIREQILAAAVAALAVASVGGHTKPTGLVVDRSPTKPAERAGLKRQSVLLATPPQGLGEEVERFAMGDSVQRSCVFAVVSQVVGTNGGGPLDTLLDPLTCWATQALLADDTLGGLALAVDEVGCDWEHEQTNVPIGIAQQLFRVRYLTRRTDPAAQP